MGLAGRQPQTVFANPPDQAKRMNVETFKYDNRIVRAFAIATIIFGLWGFSAGLLI